MISYSTVSGSNLNPGLRRRGKNKNLEQVIQFCFHAVGKGGTEWNVAASATNFAEADNLECVACLHT